MTTTSRQRYWQRAAEHSDGVARDLFTLIAQPNKDERGHRCESHAIGFRRDGRRGFRCGICREIVKWVDP